MVTARWLAIADNRTSELGLDWDVDELRAQMAHLDLREFWKDGEREQLFGEGLQPEAFRVHNARR